MSLKILWKIGPAALALGICLGACAVPSAVLMLDDPELGPTADLASCYDTFVSKDLDQNGSLAYGEFRRGLAGLGAGIDGEAKAMFRTLDRDHDGGLTASEYFPDPAAIQEWHFVEHSADRTAP